MMMMIMLLFREKKNNDVNFQIPLLIQSTGAGTGIRTNIRTSTLERETS